VIIVIIKTKKLNTNNNKNNNNNTCNINLKNLNIENGPLLKFDNNFQEKHIKLKYIGRRGFANIFD